MSAQGNGATEQNRLAKFQIQLRDQGLGNVGTSSGVGKLRTGNNFSKFKCGRGVDDAPVGGAL